jgi:hypothetical protein
MKINFITFANKNYMKTDRIAKQAHEFGMFDKIIEMNEDNIQDFIEKHKQFINTNKAGFGFWIWKPKIIYDILQNLPDNEILIYGDAGIYINKNGKERFKFYIEKLKDFDMVTFSLGDEYKSQQYVKNDAIMSFYPEFINEWTNCCYAGLMIIKKNENTVNLIKDWLQLCENYKFLDKSPSIKYKDNKYYCGNDCDNGLFNLCLAKYKINYPIYPDEVNLYLKDKQIAHTDINLKKTDWSTLDHIPFQIRRMTPKFGY